MNTLLTQALTMTVTSFVVTALLIPVLSRYSHRFGMVDLPNARKLHAAATPLVGGLAILLGFGSALIFTPLAAQSVGSLLIPFLAALALFTVAICDDRWDLPARWRLLVQVLAAGSVAASGLRLESLHGVFGITELPIVLQYFFTVILVVGVTNAFNLMDGMDGLAGGLAFSSLLMLGVVSVVQGQIGWTLVCLGLIGGLIAFLRKNTYPSTIFMGDGGSMTLGFMIAIIGLKLLQGAPLQWLDTPTSFILIAGSMLLPVIDALRVFVHRYARGASVFTPDRTHLHHLVLLLGWNPGLASRVIHGFNLISIALGCLLVQVANVTVTLLVLATLQVLFAKALWLHKAVVDWQSKIDYVENNVYRT